MSKVAEYLQEHIDGEVSTQPALLEAMSHDASVLEKMPEMVVAPRLTSDIRKICRFTWQLAEKGHIMPITARGAGTDETGAAVGSGVLLALKPHMNELLEFDAKQKLVRVQPGANAKAVNDILISHGVSIPALPLSASYSTIGGAVANNTSSPLSGNYGSMREWTHQLEIVLANGDLLQTGRISKRELNKRKGMQTFEGEIYRSLDNLIEDNKELIDDHIGSDTPDTSGYSAIAKVKQKDGSFDLAPLFVGSQGTLGIISEMILKADYFGSQPGVVVASFTTKEAARDMIDQLKALEPSTLDYYAGELFELAVQSGKKFAALPGDDLPAAVIIATSSDYNERLRHKKVRKMTKLLEKQGIVCVVAEGESVAPYLALAEVTGFLLSPNQKGASAPALFDGAYVAPERLEEFSRAVDALAQKHHVVLPLKYRALENTVFTRPILHLGKVSDKQKIFKLLDEYATLVASYGGLLVSQGGEGRMKTRFAQAQLEDEVKELYASVKAIFDPYGILNPGVKQSLEVREMVAMLRRDFDIARFADVAYYN